jgi:pentapeptide MXKDX repeat protein
MTKRIAILVMTMGMWLGLANRATTIALAQSQDDKMKDDKMAGDKMGSHDKMSKKTKKHKKEKMSNDKMDHTDKMDEQKK